MVYLYKNGKQFNMIGFLKVKEGNIMPRKTRCWKKDAVYHVTSRGNNKKIIFKCDDDYDVYLKLLSKTLTYFENKFEVYCYCLMNNHIHLMVKTYDIPLGNFIKQLNMKYAIYFNHKYNLIGHVYQDRYFSQIITTDSQMLETSRYIHLNPVRASIVKIPEDYKWSSYSVYIKEMDESPINVNYILGYFAEAKIPKKAYKEFIFKGDSPCGK